MKIVGHVVDPVTQKWFHYDDLYRLWSCGCKEENEKMVVSLCLSICDCLKDEGELRELKSQIARRRKELGLLQENQNEKI